MFSMLIWVINSQILLEKGELWIPRNNMNLQTSDGNYHIFRKYQIHGLVHHIEEYREKFSYYLFILTSQDNYYSLISLQDPVDQFRQQTIYRTLNQSCDDKFVITEFYILWRCQTTRDIFFIYVLRTKTYKLNKLMDVSDNYFIFQFKYLIRYSNNTLRLHLITNSQLILQSYYSCDFTIVDHFNNQENAMLISNPKLYLVWFTVNEISEKIQIQLVEYTDNRVNVVLEMEHMEELFYLNNYYLVEAYTIISKGQYASWFIDYQYYRFQVQICQIYFQEDQRLMVYDTKKQIFTKIIQMNNTGLSFINLQTNDLYFFENKYLNIFIEINYKNLIQPDYPVKVTHNSVDQIQNPKYIFKNEIQFTFIHLQETGQFSSIQIFIGGDITYRYKQLDSFDNLRIKFETIYFDNRTNHSCSNGSIMQNLYPIIYQETFYISLYSLYSTFDIQFYLFDQVIGSNDYIFFVETTLFISSQLNNILYIYKLNEYDKIKITQFPFDKVDFYDRYAFIDYNGSIYQYNFMTNQSWTLDSRFYGSLIQIYNNNTYAYKDSTLIIGEHFQSQLIVYQNLRFDSNIKRLFNFQTHVIIVSEDGQILKFEKVNAQRIVLVGVIELYGNLISRNSTIQSDTKKYVYIWSGNKFMVINTLLSLSQALVISFEIEQEYKLILSFDELICFRRNNFINCSILQPHVKYEVQFLSNILSYQIQLQLECSNKYDIQRFTQDVKVFRTKINLKILYNKTINLDQEMNLGKDWYQGSNNQIFSNNYEILKYIREKRYANHQQFLQFVQQFSDNLIFYVYSFKLSLYNIRNGTLLNILIPEDCKQAYIYKQHILCSSDDNQLYVYECQQLSNCSKIKTVEMNISFSFGFDNYEKYFTLKFINQRQVKIYNFENQELQEVFAFQSRVCSDYYYEDLLFVYVYSDEKNLTIIYQDQNMQQNKSFEIGNPQGYDNIYKLKILNKNHILVIYKSKGVFIYHFDQILTLKYQLFPQKHIYKQLITVINEGDDYLFVINTEDDIVLIYKIKLENFQIEQFQIKETEISLYFDKSYFKSLTQIFKYQQLYYILIQDIRQDLNILTINFDNILRTDGLYPHGRIQIRIQDQGQFEYMYLTIKEEENLYYNLVLVLLPIIYIIIRSKQLKNRNDN